MNKPIEIFDVAALKTKVATEVFERVKRRTPHDTGRAQEGWELNGTTISNDVPYIGILEMGSSDQAPEGMVKVTLEEIPSIIEQFLKETTK